MVTVNQMKEYLERFQYHPTKPAMQKILDRMFSDECKGNLLSHFRTSPYWDEENMAIILKPTEYELQYSQNAVKEFRNWLSDNIERLYYVPNSKELTNPTLKKEHYENLVHYIKSAMTMQSIISEDVGEEMNFNITYSEDVINQKLEEINAEMEEFQKYVRIYDENDNERYVSREIYDKTQNALRAIGYMKEYCNDYIITAEQARSINSYLDIRANEGQKVSKVIGKICREVGLDTIKEMKTVTSSHVDSTTGETVTIEREYDDGYNRQYQFLADGTSPKTMKQITIISLNPMDFWGMSILHKASSCHTIDINNVRNLPNSHHGMHSNGTMSYMFDPSTVIFYTLDLDKEGNIYYNEDKMKRCVFGINENGSLIMQARVYPDGRDNGDKGLAKQFRGKVQLVVSQCWNVENKWILKKGSSECRRYTETRSNIHYPDYVQYEDGSISVNKEIKDNRPIMKIGSIPYCIRCGEPNEAKDNIECVCCRRGELRGFTLNPEPETTEPEISEENVNEAVANEVAVSSNQRICAYCGEVITDESEMIEINGDYYCNRECAELAGYVQCADDDEWYEEDDDDIHFCEDDGEYHNSDNCYYDNYDGNYYSGDPYIETSDGNFYSSEEHANEDGYEQEYFSDEYWHTDEMRFDEYEGRWFDYENDNAIRTNDWEYFATEESAEHEGYVQEYLSDDWMLKDNLTYDEYHEEWFNPDDEDAIWTEDGNVYASSDSAEHNGYRMDYYTDRWIPENELIYDDNAYVWFDPNHEDAIHTTDGNVYVNSSSAEYFGYRLYEGEWRSQEEISELEEDNVEYEVGA